MRQSLKLLLFLLLPLSLFAQDPVIDALPAAVTQCSSDPIPLKTTANPDYRYRWFKDNDEITGATLPTFNVTLSGKYHVEVINISNGKQGQSNESNVEFASAENPVISRGQTSYCQGETALLSISYIGNRTRWYRNGVERPGDQDSPSISTTTPGVYTVKMINSQGCESISPPLNLSFAPLPVFTIKKSTNRAICAGDEVQLTADILAARYNWSTGANTPSIFVNTAGTYWVEVTSTAGCSTRQQIDVVIEPEIILPAPADNVLCTLKGEVVRLIAPSGYAFYTWNGQRTSNNFYDATLPGNYSLLIEDSKGCTASTNYAVIPFCGPDAVANVFSPNGDGINDRWIVGGLDNAASMVQVYNRNGEKVFMAQGQSVSWDGNVLGTPVPVGVYYYYIRTGRNALVYSGSLTIVR